MCDFDVSLCSVFSGLEGTEDDVMMLTILKYIRSFPELRRKDTAWVSGSSATKI